MTKTRADYLWEHAGLWLSGLVLLLTAIKLFAFSHGQPETVAAVLRETGATGLFGAVFVVLLPTAATYFLFVAAIDLAEATREQDRLRGPIVIAVVSGLAAFVVAPAFRFLSILGFMAFALVYSVVAVAWRRWGTTHDQWVPWLFRSSGPPKARTVGFLFVFAVPIILGAVAFTDAAWLPKERLSVMGRTPVFAYVLADQGPYWSVVDARSRRVLVLRADAVSGRAVCADSEKRSLLAKALWRPPRAQDRPPLPDDVVIRPIAESICR